MTNSILAKLAVFISANTAEFKRALAQSQGQLKSFQKGVMQVAGALGVAFGVREIAAFAVQVTKLRGEFDGVENAFKKLADSEQLLKRLKEATGGTVSELELMKKAVQASNFDISLKALPDLLEFAKSRAQQTGQSVDYLVDSIVTGIGRKSKLILDNLGISAVQLEKELNGASVAAASVGDVAEAVGRIAKRSMESFGSIIRTNATDMAKFGANWENFKVTLGTEASGVIGALVNFGNTLLESVNEALRGNVVQLEREKASLNGLVGALMDTVEGEEARKVLLDELNQKYPNFLKNLDREKVTNEQLADRLKDVNAQFERKIMLAAAEGRQKEIADDILDALDDEIDARKALVAAKEASAQAQGPSSLILGARVQALENAIANAIERRIRLQGEMKDRMKEYNDALQIFSTSTSDYFQTTNKVLDDTIKLSQTAQRAMVGAIAGSTTTAGGMDTVIPGVDNKAIIAKHEEYRNLNRETTEQVAQNWIDLSGTVSGAVSTLAEGLGAAIVGAENFGDSIIRAFIGFAKQFGEMLIASGVAALALESLIANPVTAIAAGAALVAIAGAANAALSKAHSGFMSGGGSHGGNFGSLPGVTPSEMGVRVTGRIHGYDLALVNDKTGYRRGRMG